MHTFVRNLITEWRRLELSVADGCIVVGVSGGADSVSLLLGLRSLRENGKLAHRIVASHFNHRLRDGESDGDEQFVRALTARLGVELAVGHAKIGGDGNLEQNARDARYRFLTETAERLGAFAILTGHTVNDQAETFLLNMVRGSGVTGLSGMRAVRNFELRVPGSELKTTDLRHGTRNPELGTPSLLLVRPLLTWAKRLDTESYCRDSGVEYRYDTMNEDTAFRRVRIRKILLPLLEDMNPNIIETLSNTAALMQQFCDAERVEAGLAGQEGISLSELRPLDDDKMRNTIRRWLATRRGSARRLGLKHIEAVMRLALSEKSGRVAELPGGQVVRSGGRLVYRENKVDKTEAGI